MAVLLLLAKPRPAFVIHFEYSPNGACKFVTLYDSANLYRGERLWRIQGEGPPVRIEPSEWRQREIDLMTDSDGCKYWVDVSKIDLEHWLNQQTRSTAGGKQSRLVRLLAEMFPAGVPNRDDCPREPLRAELLKRNPSLKPLDLKTLKTAIETCNRVVGNARNTSVSD